MRKIGILGEFAKDTKDIILRLYEGFKLQKEPYIVLLDENYNVSEKLDILILNTKTSLNQKLLKGLVCGGFLLVNSDEREIFKNLQIKNAILITYGFNSKSSVTASSVTESETKTIQCCIQRPLPSLLKNTILEQEFSISVKNKNISSHNILAAVTAAIVNDFPIGEIVRNYYSTDVSCCISSSASGCPNCSDSSDCSNGGLVSACSDSADKTSSSKFSNECSSSANI